MAKSKRPFVTNTFTIAHALIEISKLSGVNENELVENYLVKIESELSLKAGSLIIYYAEHVNYYRKYWYTEGTNVLYIRSFESKIFSFNKPFHPVNN